MPLRIASSGTRWIEFLVRSGALLLAIAAVVAVLAGPVPASAQAPAGSDAMPAAVTRETGQPPEGATSPVGDAQDATAAGPRESVGMLVVRSGVFSVVFTLILGLFSLLSLMVAAERLVNLRRVKVVPGNFCHRLAELCRSSPSTADDLRQLAESDPSPVARILKAGLTRAGRPLPEVEKSMEDAAARELAALRARHRPLSVIGSVAPLVGLLGTVIGMIFAFETTSRIGLGRGDQLAGSIYLALFTTAAGLTIAVPCLLLVAWFNTRIERFLRDMDESLLDTMPLFARMEVQALRPHRQAVSTACVEELAPREKVL